jgi:hypothetical protein
VAQHLEPGRVADVLTTLFDKSFLQSLSVDESVWFDQHFMPVVCPVFYAETLADLALIPREPALAEREVKKIADKFPQMHGYPCASHLTMVVGDLIGEIAPMDGRVPIPGGRHVKSGERRGIVFDQSPEAVAFNRWQQGEFLELERLYASGFRRALATLNLTSQRDILRSFGIDQKIVKSLADAKAFASGTATGNAKDFARLRVAVTIFDVPEHLHEPILRRWHETRCPPLSEFAPYADYALTVELFFQIALANPNLISAERPSNRMDIAYLFYLPFSQVFVSSDKLHSKCAPLFLREDQQFVWGIDLKADLGRMNAHYLTLPESERERGVMTFAHLPPKTGDFLTAQIYDRFGKHWREGAYEVALDDHTNKALAEELRALTESTERIPVPDDPDDPSLDMRALARSVYKRKGSWWQLPKDYPDDPPNRGLADLPPAHARSPILQTAPVARTTSRLLHRQPGL